MINVARIAVTLGLSRPTGGSFRNRLPPRSGLFLFRVGTAALLLIFEPRLDRRPDEVNLLADPDVRDLPPSHHPEERRSRDAEKARHVVEGPERFGVLSHNPIVSKGFCLSNIP